jgi:two-component system response regulator FixJ
MTDRKIVHVIDDDEGVRDSIAFLLESAGMEARLHESAQDFLDALATEPAPRCVITDIRMPDMSGIELLRRLGEGASSIPVIVITGHGDVPLAVEAMRLGAADFIEKPFGDDVLLSAVEAAFARNLGTEAAAAEADGARARIASLSTREQQVLVGLVAGHPNKTIAYDLGISPRTVEVYRANLMAKMQANSLSDLVRMALLAGAPSWRDRSPN